MSTEKKEDTIELSDHFTVGRMLRFTLLPEVSVVLSSVYALIDAWFVSYFINETAFAAVNLAYPFLLILPAVGFMIGAGGNALVSKVLGEGDQKRASQIFSMMVEVTLFAGMIMTILGHLLLEPFLKWQGAEGELLSETRVYARVMIISFIFTSLAYVFQLFLITANQQKMAVFFTLASGITNIGLDALFILVFDWGIRGAAIASVIAQMISGLIPMAYFASGKNQILRLFPVKLERSPCLAACSNGASEMIENLAEGFVGTLYNMQLIKLAGEAGVSAYGAILNIWSLLTLLFIGFDEAVVPVIAYHYGAKNENELKNLVRICLSIVGVTSLIMFAFVEIGASGLAGLFIHNNDELLAMTTFGFRICGISLLFLGVNYFATSFFTALNNGLVSGILSALVMLIFPALTVMTLPVWFGIDGIWISKSVTAAAGFICAVTAFIWGRKRYHY